MMVRLTGMRGVIAATMVLTLAACGESDEATAPVAPNAAAGATLNYQAEVAALTEAQRHAVFVRAIRDADLPCEGVESATETEPGSFIYAATCVDGTEHQVAIGADGTAQVTSAANVQPD